MKYYFIDNGLTVNEIDAIYGNVEPYCMSEDEVKHLSAEWDVDLLEKMHEASEKEITKYGKGE